MFIFTIAVATKCSEKSRRVKTPKQNFLDQEVSGEYSFNVSFMWLLANLKWSLHEPAGLLK